MSAAQHHTPQHLETQRPRTWAVLCDLDGTLLDTERPWARAVTTALLSRELAPDKGLISATEGATVEQAAQLLVRCMPMEATAAEVAAELEASVLAELNERVDWQPDAERLLAELRESAVPLALVTSSPRRWVELIMTKVDLGMFGTVITADDVSQTKPSAEPYLMAARLVGVPPENCVVIEDSSIGMRAALRAGCRVIAVGNGSARAMPELADAVAELADLTVEVLRERATADNKHADKTHTDKTHTEQPQVSLR